MLLRHSSPSTLQSPMVSPSAMCTWSLPPAPPFSHRMPRSVPVIPKRSTVLLGLVGPVRSWTVVVRPSSMGM